MAEELSTVGVEQEVFGLVRQAIEEYGLFRPGESVCVAASGGKDSLALLDVLRRLGYPVEALAVDEGIAGYRDLEVEVLRRYCGEEGVPLRVVSFSEEFGKPLDGMVEGRYPCSVCGVLRRHLLNRYAKRYDVIATGHNLDDEAQAVLMNLMKGNAHLLDRSFARSPPAQGFVPRVKPLILVPEESLKAYAEERGFDVSFARCPYVSSSLRNQVRTILNRYEVGHQGMKRSLVRAALSRASAGNSGFVACPRCGEPSTGGECRACQVLDEVVGRGR